MARIRHIGGEKAGAGNYWNFANGERISLSSEGTLPGGRDVTYYRANPVVILVAGPILGLLYAAFLPFIGLAIVGKTLVQRMFSSSAEEVTKVATFNWSPAESYLAGKEQKKNGAEKKEKEDSGPEEKPE